MIANAVFVATLIFLALGFWSMHELHFLVPWRNLILHSYLKSITLYCALLFANILGLTIWIERKFFLRDTGRKLRHLRSRDTSTLGRASCPAKSSLRLGMRRNADHAERRPVSRTHAGPCCQGPRDAARQPRKR